MSKVRRRELLRRLREAAEDKGCSIGTAWNLLDEAADFIEEEGEKKESLMEGVNNVFAHPVARTPGMIRYFLVGLGFLVALGAGARAHGDAQWIMEQEVTRWCCGPNDCKVVREGELERVEGGWLHVGSQSVLMDEDVGHYLSKDEQTWACIFLGRMRCLFLPVGV